MPNDFNLAIEGIGLGGMNYLNRVEQQSQKDKATALLDEIINMYGNYKKNLTLNNQTILQASGNEPTNDNISLDIKPPTPITNSPYIDKMASNPTYDPSGKMIPPSISNQQPVGIIDKNNYAPQRQAVPLTTDINSIRKKRLELMNNPYGENYGAYLDKLMADPTYQYFQTQNGVLAVDKENPASISEIWRDQYKPTYNDQFQMRVVDNGDGSYSKIVTYRDVNSNRAQDYTAPSNKAEFDMYNENLISKPDLMELGFGYDQRLQMLKNQGYGHSGFGNGYTPYSGEDLNTYNDILKLGQLQQTLQSNNGEWKDAKQWSDYNEIVGRLSYRMGINKSDPDFDKKLSQGVNTLYSELERKKALGVLSGTPMPPINFGDEKLDKGIGEKLLEYATPQQKKIYESLTTEQKMEATLKMLQKLRENNAK